MKTPKTSHPSFIEPLEVRVAPAGVVAVDYDTLTGILTLTGDDAGNTVSIFSTGKKTHRIEGDFLTGTLLSTGGTFLDIGKITALNLIGGAGLDTFNVSDLGALSSLSFDGGADADRLSVVNLITKGQVSLVGGAGSDTVTFRGLHTTIGGNVSVSGSDDMRLELGAVRTTIGGSLLVDPGSGFFELDAFGAGPLSIRRGIAIEAGPSETSLQFRPLGPVTIGKLPSGESILAPGGQVGDRVTFLHGPVTLLGGIDLSGGAGLKSLEIGAPNFPVRIGKSKTGHSILMASEGVASVEIAGASITAAGGIIVDAAGGSNSLFLFSPNGRVQVGKTADGESLRLAGGSGNELLRVNAGTLMLAGGVEFFPGGGQNTLDIIGENNAIKIGKLGSQHSIHYIGGTGSDRFEVRGGNVTLLGGIAFEGGEGTNTLDVDVSNGRGKLGKLATGESILFTGGSNNDFLNVTGGNFAATGGITFFGLDGSNEALFSAQGGSVSLGKLATGQSVNYVGGPASDGLFFTVGLVNLAGGIEVFGGNGSNDLDFDGSGTVRIGTLLNGMSIAFQGGTGRDDIYFAPTAAALRGAVFFNGTGGNDTLFLGGAATNIGKAPDGVSVLFDGGAGVDRFELEGVTSFAGAVSFFGKEGEDRVDVDAASLSIRGPVLFDGGDDRDRLTVDAYLLQLGSTLTFLGGAGRDDVRIEANGFITGDVSLDLGTNDTGTSELHLGSRDNRVGGLAVRGGLTLTSSGLTGELVNLTNVTIAKDFTANLSDGTSTVFLDNLAVGGLFTLSAGGGSDSLNLETERFFGPSIFSKLATILMGDGDDTLLIGSPASSAIAPFPDPTRARFLGGLTVDGGPGTDLRNDITAENDFPGGAPTGLDTFENTGG